MLRTPDAGKTSSGFHMTTADDLVALMTGRDWAAAERALEQAQHRPDADALLARAVDARPQGIVLLALDALGRLRGEDGDAALRRAMRAVGRGVRDVRGVAALALARRVGPDATDDLVAMLGDPGDSYALIALAAVGDERGVERVAEVLPRLAKRRPARPASDFAYAVAYLGRHVADRRDVVERVRSIASRVAPADRAWLTEHWPELDDGAAPDADALARWANRPPFGEL